MIRTYVDPRRFAWLVSFYGGLCRKVLADRRLFAGFVVAALLQALGHGAITLAAGLLGRSLVVNAPTSVAAWGPHFDQTTLALVGFLGAVAKAAGATAGATRQSRLAQQVAVDLRRRLADELLDRGSSLSAGQLSAMVSVALREVEIGVQDGFLGGLRAALQLAPLAMAMAWMSTRGALLILLGVAPFTLLMSLGRKRWRARHGEAIAVAEALHREVDELVAHMDVWRTYGAGARVCRVLDELGLRAQRAASAAETRRALLSSANEVLAAAGLLLAFFCAEHGATAFASDGHLVALAAVVFMSYRPLRELSDARTALERGALALTKLEAVANPSSLRAHPAQEGRQAAREHPGLRTRGSAPRAVSAAPRAASAAPRAALAAPRAWWTGTLEVHALGVQPDARDAEGRGALPRVTFNARFGEIVAVSGPTGSGKTTLLRTLLGLEPAVGALHYGERELTFAGVGPSERPFAWVSQDAPMLAGTLRDNLLLDGPEGVSSAKVREVLGLLGATDLAVRLGDATLGAAGRPVSGGERKWIALARALATDLPVLLLDEPTAGLDAVAERHVLAALERLRGTRTIILVSHQPEPLAIADRIVRLGAPDSATEAAPARGPRGPQHPPPVQN